ncbi:linear amide C-N hydrolase [Aurantimicrobium minutum]|uniref:linear amide C-N hydrolase n=1 Tax=Aurantimicrobium minutum TaxID=708131 RepID=UPI0024768569|nr:linear amide C-N hydrolase [Aurantimicrobium minutum]MDH6422740.1 choloylglycine hydrolase [Aurantimicrobium minutum]
MCTNFKLTAQDNSVVVARSMEFPDMLGAMVTAIPRGVTYASASPSGAGATWTSVHGVVGMDVIGDTQYLTDGMNEAGLYAGVLYMPGFADYEDPTGVDAAQVISNMDICNYVLTMCATVAEAFEALGKLTIWAQPQPAIGGVPPIHLVLHDKTGASGVVEFKDGKQLHVDNPIGVATNAPHLDWHYNNVRVHLPSLQALNPAPVKINGVDFAPVSQGQGFMGIPGDGSSPSRYLRATGYVWTMLPQKDAASQEIAAFHALNNFDIPDGVMAGTGSTGLPQNDRTTWSSISSLSAGRYIIRVESNPTPYVVDLTSTDFTSGAPRQIPVPAGSFVTLTV